MYKVGDIVRVELEDSVHVVVKLLVKYDDRFTSVVLHSRGKRGWASQGKCDEFNLPAKSRFLYVYQTGTTYGIIGYEKNYIILKRCSR